MKPIIPPKLKQGDTIRIIAPARSLSMISEASRSIAKKRLEELGLNAEFSTHAEETDYVTSSFIQSRIEDLHAAFSDSRVAGILTVIGGFNSNQLLRYIDWDLIRKNPKILCGYSDITILNNAIFSKTGIVGYSGPHFSTFGQEKGMDYTMGYFKKCLFEEKSFPIKPSKEWSDDQWWLDQQNRNFIPNPGWIAIHEGKARGRILGANLDTFGLLQGTEYFPKIKNAILFLEEDHQTKPEHFDRNLQSLIHQPGFKKVRGLVIGRFQKESALSNETLTQIIQTKKELENIPVIANVDFGHTDPKITFPIGGTCSLDANANKPKLTILQH